MIIITLWWLSTKIPEAIDTDNISKSFYMHVSPCKQALVQNFIVVTEQTVHSARQPLTKMALLYRTDCSDVISSNTLPHQLKWFAKYSQIIIHSHTEY